MPFLEDDAPIDLSRRHDVPKGFAVTPGAADLEDGADKPMWNWGAAFRRNNETAALASSQSFWQGNEPEAGFNPWDKVKGTPDEGSFAALSEARNTQKFNAIRTDIARENEDRKLLDSQPWWMGLVTEGTAGILSPTSLIPGGAFVKGAKGGIAVVKAGLSVGASTAASAALQERMLHGIEQTRTAGESATAIGASFFLGGLLGAGGQALLSKADWQKGVAALDAELNPPFMAFHGSPHNFDKFDGSKINTGEGNQAFGYGLYLADNKKVAQGYASRLGGDNGVLYDVNVRANREHFVDLDKSMADQSAYVREAFDRLGIEEDTAAKAYRRLGVRVGPQDISDTIGREKAASQALADAGIPGIKYLDQGSRGGRGSQNIVVFDEGILDIVRKQGKGVLPMDVLNAANSNSPLRSVGAAANTATDLADNTIAGRAAQVTAAATAQMNPLLRALHSPSSAYREIATDLVENPLYLKKNFEGVASQPAVETLMKEYNGGLAKALQATNDAFPEYRKAGGQLAKDEFREAVGKAMRRGDTDADPVIAKVAQEYRAKVFDPLKKQAIDTGLLPPDVSVDTAQSYFSRMWNGRKISADEQGFKGMVQDWVAQNQPKWAEQFDKTAERRLNPLRQELADLDVAKLRRAEELKQRQAGDEITAGGPGEMTEADIRQALRIVNGGAPKPKGVKSLSQFVVEAGGLVDDAGELAHRGITNKARPGMIRKDRRTAMSDKGGWTLDDMARHAWENDYFPANHQRPSIDEFVEALNDDFSKTRAVLKRGDEDAYRLTELVDQLEADLSRAGVKADGKAPRFSTSEEMKGAVERVYKAMDAEADRKATVLKEKLAEREADIRVDRESRFLGDPKELGKSIADEVFDTLTGRTGGGVRSDFMTVKARGPLKERTFNIEDLFQSSNGRAVEDYLEHDVEHVARRYTRVMGADVELQRKFGSVDMVDQINKIREDYKGIRQELIDKTAPKTVTKTSGPVRGRDYDVNAIEARVGEIQADGIVGFTNQQGSVRLRGGTETKVTQGGGLIQDGAGNQIDPKIITAFRQGVEWVETMPAGQPSPLVASRTVVAVSPTAIKSGDLEKQLTALAKREKDDISDLEDVRNLLRGTNAGAIETNYSRIVRMVNHVNYLRSMGEVAIASLTETVRPAMVHGLMPYMEMLGQTLTNLKGIKASVNEAQIAGVVTERVLGTRLAALSEIVDPYASRGPVEAFLENMTNIASRWNGIRLLTDMQKMIAAVLTQNRLLGNSAAFKEIAPKERAYLAYLGIDQSMAERIAKQFAEHGETVDKVHVANQEKWTDEVAGRYYRAAISKDVDSIITTKGVADVPTMANTPTGKAMFQFKSFALASHQRVLLRGLQEDQARFVGGLIAMTTIGMMATWLKAVSGNRTEKLQDIGKNPGWWIAEGFDKAGIFAVPLELSNTFEKATGFNPIKTPMKAFDEGSAISQKNQNRSLLGSIAGPSAGLIDDASSVMGVPQKLIKGEEISAGQKNAAERLLPFNSYLGIRQFLRYVANPPQ